MEYEDDGAVAVAAPKPYSSFIPSLGNFSVQFNLQVASMAVTLMVTAQDTYISKTMHVSADFPEPQWAKDALKGIVFAGAFAGMISMGYLGDLLGRRIGMMATLSLVVFGALGSAIAPWLGDPNTVYLALTILRFILGMGVGGIYPMAAASASEAGGGEASANEHGEDEEGIMRTAKAFFWQAPGAAAPYLIALIMVAVWGAKTAHTTAYQSTLLFTLGAIPACMVLVSSYLSGKPTPARAEGNVSLNAGIGKGGSGGGVPSPLQVMRAHPEFLASLIGTGGTWFLYDVSFYGINIFTPDILQSAFGAEDTLSLCWQTVVVSAVGIPACMLAIYQLPRLGARMLNFLGFITNALAFLALGLVYGIYPVDQPWLKFTFFCIVMFSLNWGPNVATYVAPVQAFPKEVRGTFHGLSAAAGKLGAALGAFIYPVMSNNMSKTGFFNGAASIFLLQVVVNLVGAALAWFYLPARAGAAGTSASVGSMRASAKRRPGESESAALYRSLLGEAAAAADY